MSAALSLFLLLLLFVPPRPASAQQAPPPVWVSAYYAGWMQSYLPPSQIDYSAVSHIMHFCVVPRADGTINRDVNGIFNSDVQIADAVNAAHAAGKPILISIGGWWTRDLFEGAMNDVNYRNFVTNIVRFLQTHRYDGVDIDMEDMLPSNGPNYIRFIRALRTALNAIAPRPLLTAAVAWEYSIFGQLTAEFDQINLMTYDMSGAWPGWVTWHNSAVSNGGFRFPSTGGLVPSIDDRVNALMAAGAAPSKIGIGMEFAGYVWSGGGGTDTGGVTRPRQGWTTAPSVQGVVPYYDIMDTHYQAHRYRWDDVALVPYLSIDNAGSVDDKFISYDDETAVRKKVEYIRSKGIGGLILFELGMGYRANQPVGQRDLLLQSVKEAAFGGGGNTDTTMPTCSITSPATGSSVSGTIPINATAADNVAVTRVEFFVDGALQGTDTTSPFSYNLDTTTLSNASHNLTAKAFDAAGNSVVSAAVAVTVSNVVAPPGQRKKKEGRCGLMGLELLLLLLLRTLRRPSGPSHS